MKNTGICPKCGSNSVIVTNQLIQRGLRSNFAPLNYICTQCGYVEVWVEEKDILRLKKLRWSLHPGKENKD